MFNTFTRVITVSFVLLLAVTIIGLSTISSVFYNAFLMIGGAFLCLCLTALIFFSLKESP